MPGQRNSSKIVYLPYISREDKFRLAFQEQMKTQQERMDKIGYFFGGAVFACILFTLAHYLG